MRRVDQPTRGACARVLVARLPHGQPPPRVTPSALVGVVKRHFRHHLDADDRAGPHEAAGDKIADDESIDGRKKAPTEGFRKRAMTQTSGVDMNAPSNG